MGKFETVLHRTWLEYLIINNYRDVASLVVDADLSLRHEGWNATLFIDLPASVYPLVTFDEDMQKTITDTFHYISYGHITDNNESPIDVSINYRVKLLDVEDNWRDVIKELIANAKNSNQGIVTDKVFQRNGKQAHLYNEMKFGSKAEIRIAQELEARQVLFFPLPLAVRADTGTLWQDHREPDFVVCHDGVWGILEVSHHLGRYEKDAEKNAWFKQAGILCVENYTAERCYEHSSDVVDHFLGLLAKHRR